MQIFAAIGCVLLCAAGHFCRDGNPPLGYTQAARALGAACCTIGALLILPWLTALILGAAMFVEFYADQQHAQGQGAATWTDAMWLTVSGVTSLVPLALAAGWLFGWWYLSIAALGILKPGIWFGWRKIGWPDSVNGSLLGHAVSQTGLAAATFGAMHGLILLGLR